MDPVSKDNKAYTELLCCLWSFTAIFLSVLLIHALPSRFWNHPSAIWRRRTAGVPRCWGVASYSGGSVGEITGLCAYFIRWKCLYMCTIICVDFETFYAPKTKCRLIYFSGLQLFCHQKLNKHVFPSPAYWPVLCVPGKYLPLWLCNSRGERLQAVG